MLALDTGQRIPVRHRLDRPQFLPGLFFTLSYIAPVGKHRAESHRKDRDHAYCHNDQQGADLHPVLQHIGIFGNARDHGIGRIVIAHLQQVVLHQAHTFLADPQHCHSEDKEYHNRPYRKVLTETLSMIPDHNAAEIQKPQYRPDNEDQLAFAGHSPCIQNAAADDIYAEYDHQTKAGRTGRDVFPILRLSRQTQCCRRYKTIQQRCSDRRDIHDPADRCPSRKHDGERKQHHEHNGLLRYALPVECSVAFRKHAVPRKCIKQAA